MGMGTDRDRALKSSEKVTVLPVAEFVKELFAGEIF
jgi:hypothetical protein